MSEEIKTMEMYCYVVNGKELWTSNPIFADIRAKHYNSKVYIEEVIIEEEKK
jgi:hypothetical protein